MPKERFSGTKKKKGVGEFKWEQKTSLWSSVVMNGC